VDLAPYEGNLPDRSNPFFDAAALTIGITRLGSAWSFGTRDASRRERRSCRPRRPVMQKHWKTVLGASLLSVVAFIASAMVGSYLAMYGVLMTSFVAGCAYLIVVARFKDRPDVEDAKRPAR
jgi:hypothetical protein